MTWPVLANVLDMSIWVGYQLNDLTEIPKSYTNNNLLIQLCI